MKEITYEATVLDGRIVLPDNAHIPNNTRVLVVVRESDDQPRVRMLSPRLAHRADAADFVMQMVREDEDAELR